MPYAFACQRCKLIVERDVFDKPKQCYIGNSWDGRKWHWDYCCACYCKRRHFTFGKDSCVYCLHRAKKKPSADKLALLQKKIHDQQELKKWKVKGFDRIPCDETISCWECGKDFIFTVGEQIFYHSKGFKQPGKCKVCRKAPKRTKRVRNKPLVHTVQLRPAEPPRLPTQVEPKSGAETTLAKGCCVIC